MAHNLSKSVTEKVYIGTYKVVKIFRKSGRREVLRRGLTKEEATTLVDSHTSNSKSMVVFYKQFNSDKYFK